VRRQIRRRERLQEGVKVVPDYLAGAVGEQLICDVAEQRRRFRRCGELWGRMRQKIHYVL